MAIRGMAHPEMRYALLRSKPIPTEDKDTTMAVCANCCNDYDKYCCDHCAERAGVENLQDRS